MSEPTWTDLVDEFEYFNSDTAIFWAGMDYLNLMLEGFIQAVWISGWLEGTSYQKDCRNYHKWIKHLEKQRRSYDNGNTKQHNSIGD